MRAAVLLLPLLLAGCVERLVAVRSEPPGATVYLDDEKVGLTPVEVEYVWYGGRELVVELRGYRPERRMISLRPPWWQIFPLDFVTDVLVPVTITDRTEVVVRLEPEKAGAEELEGILERAEALRRRMDLRD